LNSRDKEQVEAWTSEVDNLLNFAGTFLTVNTLFIDASSSALQPNNAQTAVEVLYIISQQLNGTKTAALPERFHSTIDDIIQNSFLFASLLLCLISAGLGLWVKEWLREYLLDLPDCPRELVHVQQFRHQGLWRWHMRQLVATISFLLNLAIALFSIGMILFARRLDFTLYCVLIGLSALWAGLTWGTALFPAMSARCPYKSPFSRGLYTLVWQPWSICARTRRKSGKFRSESMVDRERREAMAQATELELEALEYINREHWGHGDLQKVNQCFMDVAPERAKVSIERIIVERMVKEHMTFISAGEVSKPSDEDVLELLHLWRRVCLKTHQRSDLQDMDDEELWSEFKESVRRWAGTSRRDIMA
ncbi:hypothetical protein L227DRAFT_511584, partial [Lentinus tigrinus ALCF2SS1-6]